MKKFVTLVIAFFLTFTLSSCGNDDVITDLQTAVDNLKTQLNASDVDVADLQSATDFLDSSIAQLQADLDAVETENTALEAEIADLQADFIADTTSLSNTITLLSNQLDATAAEFDLVIQSANDQIADLLAQLAMFEMPIIYGVTEYTQSVYDDLEHNLLVFDIQEGDLSSKLVMTSPGSFDEIGTYQVTYEATDSDGNTSEFLVSVEVVTPEYQVANYLSGIDMRDLSSESKAMILAAAERYLLDNVIGGVPLYTGASRVMFSERVSLFSPEYNGVLGFGTAFSQLTQDDSNVSIYYEGYGNAGEYTWRDSFETAPTSLNPWTADDSVSEDFIDLYTGSLYTLYFDESKTGYEINGELATGDPVAINPEIINGKEFATKWQITVEDNLSWAYHPDTDTSMFNTGHEDLDANDFVWTWKNALDNDWFRAVAGGGDFISQGIKNANEYIEGNASWDDVGIKLIDDNTIELEYNSQKSMYDVKYAMTDSWNPTNEDLFTSLGVDGYGKSPETIASSGVYIFETKIAEQTLSFIKNDSYIHSNIYYFTGINYSYFASEEIAFNQFLEGRLDVASVPSEMVEDYLSDTRMYAAPDMATYRLMINGFGTIENRDAYIEQYPDFGISDEFTPEPILMYMEMKQALQFGIDRNELIVESGNNLLPAFTYFTPTYFVDPIGGISVRGTNEGASIIEDFGMGTDGYDPTSAVEHFKEAVSMAIADGFYTAGTVDNFTTIEIIFAQSYYNADIVANLEEQYEALFVDTENFVNIDIVYIPTFPMSGYDPTILQASTDIGITGISGSLLCPLSFLDTFRDDNPTGFTFNYGIDTHSVNVPVSYRNIDGEVVHELWSFNALAEAFEGKVYIKDGIVQTVFDTVEDVIAVKVDFYDLTLESIEDGTVIGELLIGQTLAEYALELEVDVVHAIIVKTTLYGSDLYIITEKDGGYEYLQEFELFESAEDAIKSHSGYEEYFVSNDGLLVDDAAIVGNAYLFGLGYTTLAEIAADTEAPIEMMEVYAVTWNISHVMSDAYAVLHIGEYYIAWEWL